VAASTCGNIRGRTERPSASRDRRPSDPPRSGRRHIAEDADVAMRVSCVADFEWRAPVQNHESMLARLWDEHVRCEFETRDAHDTLLTMVEDAIVNHVPVMTGGVGQRELHDFYSRVFIPQMPSDTAMTRISRTIGSERLVDELVFEFTHSIRMDWMLPGVAPTGRHVKVALVVIVHFRDGKVAHEHIYWDQASVLVQLGLLEAKQLPILGVESAEKVLDPSLPSNPLSR
jgi:carboxymethylenebutenolidase